MDPDKWFNIKRFPVTNCSFEEFMRVADSNHEMKLNHGHIPENINNARLQN